MRKKNPSQKHPCYREHCCGASNDHENFLSVTSRPNTRSNSKKKAKRPKKKEDTHDKESVKNIIQQSLQQMKEDNQQLLKKLSAKKKKIEELKSKIKDSEEEIRRLKEQAKHNESSRKVSQESDGPKKYTKVVQDSQAVAKQTLDNLKRLQNEYLQYRESAEKKIDKLRAEKQKLMSQQTETQYSRQIQDLKNELTRFKDEQLSVASMKNLHTHAGGSYQEKARLEIATLKTTVATLRAENERLQEYSRELEDELEERTTLAQNKERELKNNLDAINLKIMNWERENRLTKEDAINWEREYHILLEKYQRKKEKHKANNAEWAQIFKQFIQEIDHLKQELDLVSQRNAKLIKLHGSD